MTSERDEPHIDARTPELLEALAILASGAANLGYPSKAAHGIVHAARVIVDAHAKAAMERITGGLCTTCWGDGFHRTSTFMLSGACHDCNGSGRREPAGDRS